MGTVVRSPYPDTPRWKIDNAGVGGISRWYKRQTTGEGAFKHSARKHPDIALAGKNYANNEIRERSLTPEAVRGSKDVVYDWAVDGYEAFRRTMGQSRPVPRESEAFIEGYYATMKEFAFSDAGQTPSETKTCPMCAEDVKAAARICRFCGHSIDSGGA